MLASLNKSFPFLCFAFLFLYSCSSIPEGAEAVSPFDKTRYLGKWYEIARLDNYFERGLSQTTASYALNDDGSIKVVNRGFDAEEKEWKEASGKAKFVDNENIGMLKVSFFGPFYGGYNVIALDTDYNYALVAGDGIKYLWILSRETTLPEKIKTKYLEVAEKIGYDIDALIWVEHK